jgi:hypothetical protein
LLRSLLQFFSLPLQLRIVRLEIVFDLRDLGFDAGVILEDESDVHHRNVVARVFGQRRGGGQCGHSNNGQKDGRFA